MNSPSPKRRSFLCGLLAITSISASISFADKKKDQGPIHTDPAKVEDKDFAIQGEYVGTAGGEKWGVQVIAQGDGAFAFVAYPGGLPGGGWSGDKDQRLNGTGKWEGEKQVILTSDPDNGSKGVIEDGWLKLYVGDAKEPFGELKRLQRESPTLGKKAPEGAIILFDGKNADAWTGKAKELMDGNLLVQGVTSKERFQDFHLHMEFRTPYKPKARGQGRGNSGFYAQGRYEVQILDSFGLEGEQNECGGIYSVGKPLVNMCYPPLSWQTYDVDFKAARYDADGKKTSDARLTVRHNGTVIHKDIVADHATTASPMQEGPEPGPIFFQDHGNPVRFRNVWLVKK